MTAAADIGAIRDWLDASSPARVRAPMGGDWIWPAPFAALLPVDPDAAAGPQLDLSDLSEGGMVFLCPQGQLSAPFADDRLSRAVAGLPSLVERVRHLFGHRLGVVLPDVLTLALSSPSQSVVDVLAGEGLGVIDLAAVAVLAVPLWAIPVADRPTVAALCRHP